MFELRVLEECNGLIPAEEVSSEEIESHFNEAFINAFKEVFPNSDILLEFAFAMDLLIEMAKLPGFPQDRFLDSPDIKPSVGGALKRIGIVTHNKTLIGVAVSESVKERISEFFNYEYPKLLDTIFTQLKTLFVTFHLDNIQHELIYYREHASIPTLNSFRLTWEEMVDGEMKKFVVCLPFNNKRVQ